MTLEELIVMLREYSERGSEEDFAEAAGFLEAFQYENKEYRKQMTTQVARIEELEKQLAVSDEEIRALRDEIENLEYEMCELENRS